MMDKGASINLILYTLLFESSTSRTTEQIQLACEGIYVPASSEQKVTLQIEERDLPIRI